MPAHRNTQNKTLSHDIPGARITGLGVVLCVAYLGLPVLVLGNLADLFVQWVFGWCVGFWCIF